MRPFIGNERGAAAVEFAIVFMVLLAVTLGVIEFSVMLWRWHNAEKATQFGARYAVVSNVVAPGLKAIGTTAGSSEFGAYCLDRATQTPNPDCWFDPVVCTQSGCSNYGFSADAFNAIVARMRSVAPWIDPAAVRVEYSFVGLGFVGRPGGQPMLVAVRLVGQSFSFIVIDALLGLRDSIPMPEFVASLQGEDLEN